MKDYPWTQADRTPELDQLANEAGIAEEERKAEMNATQLKILAAWQCPTCHGRGKVYNEVWELYYNHFTGLPPSEKEERHFWLDLGYTTAPPEEVDCQTCLGSGEEHRWLTASQLKAMLDNLPSNPGK